MVDTLKVGDVILDKYELTGELGKGGMGVVWAARHRELGGLVALKFLLPSGRASLETTARFAQEARIANQINSPHVARVDDVGTYNGVPFIVMEHLIGRDLAAMIEKRGQLGIEESADLLLQAGEAIQKAHTLGIVHRDLKPANLFVTRDPDDKPFVKVLDFGIAKSAEGTDVSVTASSATLGSPQYMSPEQHLSTKNVDERTDVWALGAILYEMLTGEPPFTGDTVAAVTAAILAGQLRKPSDLRARIPRALEQTLEEALAFDRNARLPSVKAFAERLAPFGSDAGRVSYGRIQRIATGSQASTEAPPESGNAEGLKPSLRAGDRTGHVTITTDGPIVSPEPPPPTRRKRTLPVVLAGLAAVAGLAAAVPRLVPARSANAEPATPASGEAARPTGGPAASVDPAVADFVDAAGADGGVEEDVATVKTTTATPSDPGPASRTTSIAAGALEPADKARAGQPARAGICASGATPECQAACDGGSADACNSLAVLYATGNGVSKNLSKAVSLYTSACDASLAIACVNLGTMHFEGSGVPKNDSLGARFFLQGCDGGAAVGCQYVSIAYAEGRGVPKDPAQALAYAQRACKGGWQAGCVRTELARIKGEGVAKDVPGGLAQLDGMCARKQAVACENLATLYDGKSVADVAADPVRVRDYLKKACDAGSNQSCQIRSVLAKGDKVDSDRGQGNALFEDKCAAGSALECGLLGENLMTGTGIARDPVRGAALLKKACEHGVERACKDLAEGGAP